MSSNKAKHTTEPEAAQNSTHDESGSPSKPDAAQSSAHNGVGPPSKPLPGRNNTFFESQWRRALNRLYWLFPNWRAGQRGDISYERAHDIKENAKMQVPPGLELRVPIVWGCELYGPDEINGLYAGLRKFQWGISYRIGEKDGIERWVRDARAYGRQDSWLNGGLVVRPSERGKYLAVSNYAALPNGVVSLHIEVFQLSSSITGVLVGFRFDDTIARRYEIEINHERSTYRKRIPRSSSIAIIGPTNQKQYAVAGVRSSLRSLVADWYKHHLPGYFSAASRESVFPVLQLLSVKHGPILQEPPSAPRNGLGWRWLLGHSTSWEVWTCQRNIGIQLAMCEATEGEDGRFITVSVDESKFSKESTKPYGGKSINALIHICHNEIHAILPHAAAIAYLRQQTRYLNAIRERLKEARASNSDVKSTLLTVSEFFDQTLGVPASARELASKSKESGWYRGDFEFTAPSWDSQAPPQQLWDALRSSTHFMATRLVQDEAVMREHFAQLSSILSIGENVKVQHRMELLTVVAVTVAVLSLLVALAGLHTVADWLKSVLLHVQ